MVVLQNSFAKLLSILESLRSARGEKADAERMDTFLGPVHAFMRLTWRIVVLWRCGRAISAWRYERESDWGPSWPRIVNSKRQRFSVRHCYNL